MRIAIDALSVVPNETHGGETYLVELLRAMEDHPRAQGHEIVVYCSQNAIPLFRERGAVKVRAVPLDNRGRGSRLAFEHLRLASLLKTDGMDALYAPGNALPWRVKCPTVLGIQSLHSFVVPEEMSGFRVRYFRRVVPWSARRADRVLCVSEDIKRTLLRVVPGLDSRKIRVVYEGAPQDVKRVEDDDRVREVVGRYGLEPGRFVLFVSSLNPFKRPERAVQAVAEIRRATGMSWPLLLAGRASPEHKERVLAAAREEEAEDLVRIVGTVGRDELCALFTGARVMVYPSTVETFGLPPLEAMACGCPVVAANRTSIPEVTGDAALLVDPDDIAAFSALLRRAIEDEDLRAELIRRGLDRARHFQWSDAADETLALIEDAAASR